MKFMAVKFDATAKNLFIRFKGVYEIDFNALTDALRGYTVCVSALYLDRVANIFRSNKCFVSKFTYSAAFCATCTEQSAR